jgi:hypothetical protein
MRSGISVGRNLLALPRPACNRFCRKIDAGKPWPGNFRRAFHDDRFKVRKNWTMGGRLIGSAIRPRVSDEETKRRLSLESCQSLIP